MFVNVNGKQREIASGSTLAGLVLDMRVNPEFVVIELNRNIIDKGSWAGTLLNENDIVEIVSFVCGG